MFYQPPIQDFRNSQTSILCATLTFLCCCFSETNRIFFDSNHSLVSRLSLDVWRARQNLVRSPNGWTSRLPWDPRAAGERSHFIHGFSENDLRAIKSDRLYATVETLLHDIGWENEGAWNAKETCLFQCFVGSALSWVFQWITHGSDIKTPGKFVTNGQNMWVPLNRNKQYQEKFFQIKQILN